MLSGVILWLILRHVRAIDAEHFNLSAFVANSATVTNNSVIVVMPNISVLVTMVQINHRKLAKLSLQHSQQ